MLTNDEFRLLRDFQITGFAMLCRFPQPEIVTDLTRRGMVEWHWHGGVPIYEVTEIGKRAISQHPNG